MTTFVRLFMLALAVVALAGSSFAASQYTQSVTSASSVYITNTQHGFGTCSIGISVYDNAGQVMEPSGSPGYVPSCSSNDVTINFNASFTGTVKLIGPLNADNNASDAFKPTVNSGKLIVCTGATLNNHQAVSVSGVRRVCLNEVEITPAVNWDYTIRVWLDGQKIVVASDDSYGAMPTVSRSGNGHIVKLNYTSSMPSGKIAIATWNPNTGLVDQRTW